MIVLGVDPGTRLTGWGVVDVRPGQPARHVDHGTIRTDAKTPLWDRLAIIHAHIGEVALKHRPQALALEQCFVSKNVQSALKLGHTRGVIMVACLASGAEVFEYAPSQINKSAVTGNGRASKEQVTEMVRILLRLPKPPQEDAADALAAAICHTNGAGLRRAFTRALNPVIAWLSGKLRARGPGGRLIIDVGGVGYAVSTPLTVAADVALGATVTLHVHTHVREDQLSLFGFEDELTLETFLALNGVAKVGPKLALSVLSGIDARSLAQAVEHQDMARLTSVSGVGKRLAERLVVELKGKLPDGGPGLTPVTGKAPASREPVAFRDLRSALANLEYRPKEVDAVVAALRKSHGDAPFDELLREALRALRK